MEPRPEAFDMTALAARIRPLAHEASVGLGLASEDLRQTLDHAGDAIATRVADGWPDDWEDAIRRSPLLLAVVSRLRHPVPLGDGTWSLGRWLLLATVVATITALAAAALTGVLRSRRDRGPAPAADAAVPIVIPVSLPPAAVGPDVKATTESLRSA
jgi:hypothetical protein